MRTFLLHIFACYRARGDNNNNEFISSQYTKNSIKLIKIDNIKIKYKNNLNIIKIDIKIQEETIYKYSNYETYIWNINFADSTRT